MAVRSYAQEYDEMLHKGKTGAPKVNGKANKPHCQFPPQDPLGWIQEIGVFKCHLYLVQHQSWESLGKRKGDGALCLDGEITCLYGNINFIKFLNAVSLLYKKFFYIFVN